MSPQSKNQPSSGESNTSDFEAASYIIFGVAFPILALFVEITLGLSKTLVDPIPSFFHTVIVAFVPVSNWLVLTRCIKSNAPLSQSVVITNGFALAIAGIYAVLMLPIWIIAAPALIWGIGIVGFAPQAAFIQTLRAQRQLFHRASKSKFQIAGNTFVGMILGVSTLMIVSYSTLASYTGLGMIAADSPDLKRRGYEMIRHFGDYEFLQAICPYTTKFNFMIAEKFLFPRPLSVKETKEIVLSTTGKACKDF